MRKTVKLFCLIAIAAFAMLFSSCDLISALTTKIEVSGNIHYTTGEYGQVTSIDFTVTGGEAPYKIYYARSGSNSESYARSNRSYIGVADEEGTSYTCSCDGYVSVGWYYFIWAVDQNGVSDYAVWHP